MATFEELGISKDLLRAVQQMGFEEATPIQSESIPIALKGQDLIGQAQTGTGKTAAFGLPMIEKIQSSDKAVQGLVIAPTRELAIQVAEELNKLGKYKKVGALAIYGGEDIRQQIRALKKRPAIIAGTPGRLLDHIKRKTIRLQDIQTVVLDEADEMLNMGFIEDIESILKEVPEERQTLLFSATMPKPIQNIAERFMKKPELVKMKAKEMTVSNIEQFYIELHEKNKFDTLTRLLDIETPELAIVFGRTKRRVDELTQALANRGYAAEGIHGDLTQAKRSRVLKKFKGNQIDVLVATDVAARGLDISGVTHVYNFDIPQDPESYVHRIGRTGRAGKSGQAYTFVTGRERTQLRNIEFTTKRKIQEKEMPSQKDALEEQRKLASEKLLEAANKDSKGYETLAKELLEKGDAVQLVSAALKLLTKEPDATPVRLTAEAPVVAKDKRRGSSNRPPQNRRGKSGGRPQKNRYDNNRSGRGKGRNKEKANKY